MAASKQASKAYSAILAEHRARFERVSQRTAPATMRKIYDDANKHMARKIAVAVRAGKGDTFTVHQHRVLLGQVRVGQAEMARRMASGMNSASADVQTESLRGLISDVTRLERQFTGADLVLPIEEASMFYRAAAVGRPSLIKMHAESFSRLAGAVSTKIAQRIGLSLATGETTGEAIDAVQDVADNEWWQAERIVRTETAYAYNKTHQDGMKEVASEVAGIMQMWSEHVDPMTGAPLDDRVAVDSIAMAGQVAELGGMFTMPSFAPFPDASGNQTVPESLAGRRFECPPSRPNGREVIAPWRRTWGVPGWKWEGRRVPLNA